MDRKNLVEIRKGESGTGLLIEHDGYISIDCGDNKKLFEDINSNTDDDFHCPRHFIVSAVFQKYGVENANGRIYPEHVLKKEVQKYMDKINEKRAIGELNHPSESVIDLSRVAMNIIELHWEGRTLVGKLELLTSPGFRKYGIISNQADQAANLLLSGIKIGVSSRGLGTVTNKMGVLYVSDDYEIVCWDIVSDPSTPQAWITPEDNIPQQYIENTEKDEKKSKLFESLDKFTEWLND
jgi:hypothetical protein